MPRILCVLPLAAFAVVTPAVVGCEQGQPARSAADLPRWEAQAREVFDDNIDPAAVGLSMDGPSPKADPFLRERACTADVVARVRVQTVTVDTVGDQQTYHFGVQVVPSALTDAQVQDGSFELTVKPKSLAFGIARAFDARLRGRTFVAFLKRFGDSDGDTRLHWHLSPDSAEVITAIKEALALRKAANP